MKGTILNLDISEKDVRRVDPFLIKNLANITYQQYGDADSEYDLFLYNLVNAVEQYCMKQMKVLSANTFFGTID